MNHDLIIIGAGPGGYVAAIRAAQLGLNVACVEKEPDLGGTCLRVGCIPSKAMLESSHHFAACRSLARHGVKVGQVELDLPVMLARKEQVVRGLTQGVEALFKKNKVTRYRGQGRFLAPGKVVVQGQEAAVELQAPRVIIATGSLPATLPGIAMSGDRIGGSTEALCYTQPPAHLVVIGGGYIGLELGTLWRRLGSKVTVLEYLDHILPGIDRELSDQAQTIFAGQGLEFRLGTRVTGARVAEQGCVVEVQGGQPIACDRVLVAVGRKPNTQGLGLEAIGLATDKAGRIPIDDHWATKVPGVFAIGDVVRGPMLAHKAEDEGIACVEQMVQGYGHVNYQVIPAVVYTDPELASVGQTQEQLSEAGVAFRKGVFPFKANGRARTLDDTQGFVKVLADQATDRILGVHIIGPRAGDMIAEAAAAMEFGASSEDLARCCHAHPTLAETLREAAMAVAGQPIHR